MKTLKDSWNWVKNHIAALNFMFIVSIFGFMIWLIVHTASVETQLQMENKFLRENLIRMENHLDGAIKHVNDQETVIRNQNQVIENQERAIKQLIDRINNLSALLSGNYT